MILIFLLISISTTGSGNDTDSHGSPEVSLEQKIGASSADKILEQKQDNGKINNQEITEEKMEQKGNRNTDRTRNWGDAEENFERENRKTDWEDNEEKIEKEDRKKDWRDNEEKLEKKKQKDSLER